MGDPVRFRVDRVPTALRPLADAYGVLGAAAIRRALMLLGASFRLQRVGLERARAAGAIIECLWHENVLAYLVGILDDPPKVTLFHPAFYLKPLEVLARRTGWQIAMGSAGNDGRAAADQVVEHLRGGATFYVHPDGPSGPPRRLKQGVLHIARDSGRPVVPIRFEYSAVARLPTWDRKILPLPGSTVRQIYGEPLFVGNDLEGARATLERAL